MLHYQNFFLLSKFHFKFNSIFNYLLILFYFFFPAFSLLPFSLSTTFTFLSRSLPSPLLILLSSSTPTLRLQEKKGKGERKGKKAKAEERRMKCSSSLQEEYSNRSGMQLLKYGVGRCIACRSPADLVDYEKVLKIFFVPVWR
jgi:hypothetical protein